MARMVSIPIMNNINQISNSILFLDQPLPITPSTRVRNCVFGLKLGEKKGFRNPYTSIVDEIVADIMIKNMAIKPTKPRWRVFFRNGSFAAFSEELHRRLFFDGGAFVMLEDSRLEWKHL